MRIRYCDNLLWKSIFQFTINHHNLANQKYNLHEEIQLQTYNGHWVISGYDYGL